MDSSTTRAAYHRSHDNDNGDLVTTINHHDHDPNNDTNILLVMELVMNYLKQESEKVQSSVRLVEDHIQQFEDAAKTVVVANNRSRINLDEIDERWREQLLRHHQVEKEEMEKKINLIFQEFSKQKETHLEELKYVKETMKHLQQALTL